MGSNQAAAVRSLLTVVLTGALAIGLVGCTQPATGGHHPATPVSSASAPQPTASSTAVPVLDLAGTAKQNLAYFDKVGHALLDDNAAANANGRTIVDYFVQAGFPKKDMEVTPDKTSIGLAASNIEFSVKINGSCLIGQAGNVGFNSFAAPLVSTGTCLIGQTRKIDW
jgi:hypothetical protein